MISIESERAWKPHTKEAIAEICALKGVESAREIALRFGMTRNAVIGLWARNKGLTGRPGIRPGPEVSGDKPKAISAAPKAVSKPAPPPPPPVAPPPATEATLPCSAIFGASDAVIALRYRDCRFPIGHPVEPNFRFCCAPAEEGKPYCAEHARRCVTARVPLRMPAYVPMDGTA